MRSSFPPPFEWDSKGGPPAARKQRGPGPLARWFGPILTEVALWGFVVVPLVIKAAISWATVAVVTPQIGFVEAFKLVYPGFSALIGL